MFTFKYVSKLCWVRCKGTFFPEYGNVSALKKVNLTIPTGGALAILGPNRAGKSTLCRIAAAIIISSEGQALLDGREILAGSYAISESIRFVQGLTLLYYKLTGNNCLVFFASFYEVRNYEKRIVELATFFNLKDWLNTYSGRYLL